MSVLVRWCVVVVLLLGACGGTQGDDAGGGGGREVGAGQGFDGGPPGSTGSGGGEGEVPAGSPSETVVPGSPSETVVPGSVSTTAPKAAGGAAGAPKAAGGAAGAPKGPSGGAAGAPKAAAGGAAGAPKGPSGGAAPVAPGGPAPGGGLKATDVGVSETTIKLGTIGAMSGAMPGQFSPNIKATQAYLNMVNERGGIHGRKVQLVVKDDALDGTKNLAASKALVEDDKVFAIVGEASPAQDSGAKYINDRGVPNIGINGGIGNAGSLYDKVFPVLGAQGPGKWTSVYTEWGKQFGNRCGVIDLSIAISQQSGAGQEASCKQAGLAVPYRATVQVVQPDFTAEVTRMRAADLSFLVSIMENNSNIRMLQAMRRQNYIPNPILFTGYDEAVKSTVGDVMEKGVTSTVGNAAFEMTANPELQLALSTYKKYFPDSQVNIWVTVGWQAGMLFTEAAQAVGPNLTREAIVKQLNGTTTDFRGTSHPIRMTFGQRTQFSLCTPLLNVKNGAYNVLRGLDNCGKPVSY